MASRETGGVLDPGIAEEISTFSRLSSAEGKAAYANQLIGRLARGLEHSWPVLYEALAIVRDRGLYAVADMDRPVYGSFEEYFVATMGRPIATWAELEANYRFVERVRPELIEETFKNVTAARLNANGGDRRSESFQSSNRRVKAGTNREYTLARLERDGETDLLLAIERGEISPHQAAIDAGYVKRKVTVEDGIYGFARYIRKHFTRDQIEDLITALREA